MKLRTIDDFFNLAGGTIYLAAFLGLHQTTVITWAKSGIPTKYWNRLMEEYKVTAEQLFNISENARGNRN